MALPTPAARIDLSRLLRGGLLSGVVVSVITGFANARVLDRDMQAWANGMAGRLHPPAPPAQVGLWTLMCLIDGFVGVWLYAAMRPRYGAGPATALRAGLSIWIVGRFCVALDLVAVGVFPTEIMLAQGLLGLVAILPAVLLGAWIYRE